MRTRRTGSAALLLSTVTHRTVKSNQLREGIQATLAEHALHLLIASLPDARLTDDEYLPQVLRDWATGASASSNPGRNPLQCGGPARGLSLAATACG